MLLAGFFELGLNLSPILIALGVELPFFVVGYKRYRYPLLFLAALIYGMGNYLLAYMGDVFFAFEKIIATWIVAFLSPLLVYAVARLTNRL